MKISLAIPAFNEAHVICGTIAEAVAYFEDRNIDFEIIVVADGDDGTREKVGKMAADDPRIHVKGSLERRGKGVAVREAVFMATGDIFGFVDADNKTPITDLDNFLPYFREAYDIVIGSRPHKDSRIVRRQPWFRLIGGVGFGVVMKLITGIRGVKDTQCGFKFFQIGVARELFSRQIIDGYMFDVEIVYLAQKAGYRLKQVGVTWRDDGDSRLVLVRGNIRNILDVIKIRFNRYPTFDADTSLAAENATSDS